MQVFQQLIIESLVQLHNFTGNLGWAIILFTFLVRSLLMPLSLPAMKSQKQIMAMKPELDELKKKHKGDPKAFQSAQLELYKKYNVNPLVGCLPQLIQIGLLIVLYRVLSQFVTHSEVSGVAINPLFYWLDLRRPDSFYILPFLAGFTQLLLSLMILPGGETPDLVSNTSKNKAVKAANEKEEDTAEMAATMQKQMLFIMPIMSGFLAVGFPSGLALYWVATTVFSMIQQLVITGPGGLVSYPQQILARISRGNRS